jgi:hypothetical protein
MICHPKEFALYRIVLNAELFATRSARSPVGDIVSAGSQEEERSDAGK